MKIYLVRHGEKENDLDNSLLTEEGERQINLLARRLKQDKIVVHRIYTTNYPRTLKTAEILSKILYLPVVRDDRLKELDKRLFESAQAYDSLDLNNFLDEVIARKKDVILAMHGGINRAVIAHLTGLSLKDMSNFFMDFGSLSLIEHVSINGIMTWRVKMLNDTTHLFVP